MSKFRTPAILVAGSLAITGCSNVDLEGNRNAIGGALAGALGGAVVGNVVGEEKSTRRGALLGGIAGAALGANLDRQEAALRQQMGGSGALIQNTGSQLLVTLPEAITFDVDSAAVKPQFQSSIAQLAANLQQYPNSTVTVVGHTDNTGSVSYNQTLSEGRARSVAGILIGNGVNPNRISTFGEGEFSPVASNATTQGRQQNRRVVITITPTNQG